MTLANKDRNSIRSLQHDICFIEEMEEKLKNHNYTSALQMLKNWKKKLEIIKEEELWIQKL